MIDHIKLHTILSEFITDKVNLVNFFTGFGAYWLYLLSASQQWVQLLTPLITFFSVLCLCCYNLIKLWRTLKNKHEN
jgi:hypothetical protein